MENPYICMYDVCMQYPNYSRNQSGITAGLTIVIVQQSTVFSFLDQNKKLEPGDLYFFHQGIEYSFDTMDSCVVYLFPLSFFDELFLSQIADCRLFYDFITTHSDHEEYLFFECAEDLDSLSAAVQLGRAFEIPDLYQDKLLRASLVMLITYLDRSHDSTLILSESTMLSNHRFGMVLKYMGDNYATVTLSGLAEQFGYNPDYLSWLIHHLTHQTFKQKLLSLRLNQAERLLRQTELSIENISLQIGFKDKSYFNQKFKLETGMTPLACRKKYKNTDMGNRSESSDTLQNH